VLDGCMLARAQHALDALAVRDVLGAAQGYNVISHNAG
jgi:hypothetical protein